MKGAEKEASLRPMKIAHCLPDQHWAEEMRGENPRDAAHIQQKYIAEGLRARGHSVTWIAPQGLDDVCVSDLKTTTLAPRTWTASRPFETLGKFAWKAQQLLRIPYLNYFSNLRRYDACLRVLPGHDVVFERNALYNSGVAMACEKLHLPYVMFFDADQIAELDFMGKPLKGLLRWRAKRLLRYNLRVARRIICVSKIAKDHLMKTWDAPADKLVVLPNAVDVNRFEPDPELSAQTRASLSLTAHPLLVFVGSFYQWHDVVALLKAFALVLKTHSEARLFLVGDGAGRERMMQLSVDLGLEGAAQFTGFVTHAEVVRYVSAADIAVVPVPTMKQQMWLSPMKLFEYMASGKAIVASAMGQIKDVIRDGDNGLLVPAGDEAALADAIIRLIEDVPLRVRLGRQAREDAVKDHSWEGYLSRLEDVF
ncbi:MAG: glycosyltransferase family 4 protein, partial [Anaerolineales bacterium]|nr:glycosyltransferase family 4 protein [Anaerolineales bacterium]